MDTAPNWIAELLRLGSQHKDLVSLLKDLAELPILSWTLIGGPIIAVIWLWRQTHKPKQPDPKLSAPPLADRSLTRYSARAVELLGREEAMARLQAFLHSDGGFACAAKASGRTWSGHWTGTAGAPRLATGWPWPIWGFATKRA